MALNIINNQVNAVAIQVLPNGKTYLAIASDSGVSIVNETDETVVDITDASTQDKVNKSWLTSQGELYFSAQNHASETTYGYLYSWLTLPTTDQTAYTDGDKEYTNASTPAFLGTGISDFFVVEGKSEEATDSNAIHIVTDLGVTVLHEKQADEANGRVHYITKDYNTLMPLPKTVNSKDVSFWDFSTIGATIDDVTINSNDLTRNGTPVAGTIGALPAVDFGTGNTNKYLEAADAAWNKITGSFTFVCVADLTVSPTSQEFLIAKYDHGVNKRQYLLSHGTTNTINFNVSSDGSSYASAVTDDAYTGVHSIVGRYDAALQTLTLYIDGVEASVTLSGTVPSSLFDSGLALTCGCQIYNGAAAGFMDGKMFAHIIPEAKSDAWCENQSRILYELATNSPTESCLLSGNNNVKGVSYDQADDVLWLVDADGDIQAYDSLKQRFLKQITTAGIGTGDSISVNSGIGLAGGATKAVTRALGYISIDDTLAPQAPENIIATGGLGRVTISWSRPSAQDIDHYKVIVKNESDVTPPGLSASYDNIYAEQLTIYNLTDTRDSLAKRTSDTTNYWQAQVIVYDINGNSSQSTWVVFDERTPGTSGVVEQNSYLENYQPASGTAPSSAAELLTALGTPANGNDADINITFAYGGLTDVDEIEKLILQRERQGDNVWSTVVEIASQSNSFSGAPTTYHDTNLLNETGTGSAPSETFKYRLVAVSFGGMVTIGTATSAISCTDTTGQNVSSAGISGDPNIGSVHLEWTDVIDKNGALYELYRSPNNTWATLNNTHEKIAAVPSSRGGSEKLYYADNDWDNITGKIPDDKTAITGPGVYGGRTAYYRLVGVDRFGNRYALDWDEAYPSNKKHSTTAALSSQYYAPAIPVDDTCVALFPFSDGIISTKGHVPKNTNIPQCYLRNDGKWGGGAISFKTAPEDILEYATNLLKDGDMEKTGVINWSATTDPTKSTDKFFQGSQGLKLPDPSSTVDTTQSFTTTASTDYFFDSWCHIDSGDTLIITLTGDTSAATSSLTISGNGSLQHISFVFRTGSGDTSTTLKFTTNVGNSGDIYIDYAFAVQSLATNGGMEGTYTSGLAPNWTDASGAGTLAEEATTIHSGSKSQKVTATADGQGITQQLSGLTVSNIYHLSGWLYNDSGKSKIVCDGVTAYQTRTGAWDKVDLVFAATVTNPTVQVFSSGGAATFYIDDVQAVELSSFNKDDRTLEYVSTLVSVTDFTLDVVIRHSWIANDSLDHYILDTTGGASNKNRFYLMKDSSNNLVFRVYGAVVGGYKQVSYAVTESNFTKDTWHRISVKFDADMGGSDTPNAEEFALFLNGSSVGSATSGGTWNESTDDPTTWGATLYVGGDSSNDPGDVDMNYLSIWNIDQELTVLQTWHDVNQPFIHPDAVPIVVGVANPTTNHTTSEVSEGLNNELPPAVVS